MKKMKVIKNVMWLMALMVIFTSDAQAQKSTNISYRIDNGPVFPIEGESNLITGSAHIDTETYNLENLSFDVYLDSFTGMHSDYIAWLGNSWQNPELKFKGQKVTKKGNDYVVRGTMEFRRRYAPVDINVSQRISGNEIILEGNFSIEYQ